MQTIQNIVNEKYNLNGDLFFTANGKDYTISQKDALSLAYTLYDSLGLPYTELDKVADLLEEGGGN